MPFEMKQAPGATGGLIEVLSLKTYPTLFSAMREVVSNASDADATRLNITLSSTFDSDLGEKVHKLTFFDDGDGMTSSEFRDYLRLAGSGRRKRTGSQSTTSGRPIIGMMGIGSLAVASWARRVEILTKKPNTNQVLHVIIPYEKFFADPDVRDKELFGENGIYDYQQNVFDDKGMAPADIVRGFTIVDLVGLNETALGELFASDDDDVTEWNSNDSITDLMFFGPHYSQQLASLSNYRKMTTTRKMPPLLAFMHRLALVIPVPYPNHTPIRYPPINTFVKSVTAFFLDSITFQGVKLQRPMLILDQQTETERDKEQSSLSVSPGGGKAAKFGKCEKIDTTLPKSGIHIKGYIWVQNSSISFEDLRGIQVRIKNVGIGGYSDIYLQPPLNEVGGDRRVRASQTSGEIFIELSDALEAALRSDREGFLEGSRVYRELRTFVYAKARKLWGDIDKMQPKGARDKASRVGTQNGQKAADGGGAPTSPYQKTSDHGAGAGAGNAGSTANPTSNSESGEHPEDPGDSYEAHKSGSPAGSEDEPEHKPRASETARPTDQNPDPPKGNAGKTTSRAEHLDTPTLENLKIIAKTGPGSEVVTVFEECLPRGLNPDTAKSMCEAAADAVKQVTDHARVPYINLDVALLLDK